MTQAMPSRRELLFLSFGMILLLFALPGRTWAQTSRIVSCSSDDMRYHVCDAGPNRGIRLVRQRSESPCERNRSYGLRGDQIWVDRGCRADFEVLFSYEQNRRRPHPWSRNDDDDWRGRRRNDRDEWSYRNPGGFIRSGETFLAMCYSNNMRRNYCTVGPNRGIRLVRQFSDSPCYPGRTFGIRGDQIWVDRGCRAQFEVRSR
jgi:hypothetical protein